MKNTKSILRQAALITAVILGSSGWVSAQTNQGRTSQGQYTPGQSTGQYNPGQTTGQYNQGLYNQGLTGQTNNGLDRQPAGIYSDRNTNSPSLQLTKISKGSSIIGATVKNQQGETLGEVRDLVIDYNSGRVAYLVLETDAGVFRAEKMHAVPLSAFQPDATGTSLILNADKTKLEASAGFDKDNWPAATSGIWGAEPSWKDDNRTTPSSPPRRMEDRSTGNETNRMGNGVNNTNNYNTNNLNRVR